MRRFLRPILLLIFVCGLGYLAFSTSRGLSQHKAKNEAAISTLNKRNEITTKTEKSAGSAIDAVQERTRLKNRIKKIGAEGTYQEFKKEFATSHFSIQHNAMHILGELLYETKGIDGLTICDNTFAFGCYHSFFGKALIDKGIEVTRELDKACVKKYGPLGTGCQHGVGHGLLEYIGRNNLVKALEACKFTTQLKELFGCTSGVFMEYNVPIIINADVVRTEVRKLEPNNPYEPCNTIVPEKFRKSCYYEMGQWWNSVFGRDYKKIGSLCLDLPEEYQETCYLGIGNVASPTSDYVVEDTVALCKQMPNQKAETICRAGASWSMFSVPERRHLAPLVCEGLGEKDKLLCATKSDLIGERNNSSQQP